MNHIPIVALRADAVVIAVCTGQPHLYYLALIFRLLAVSLDRLASAASPALRYAKLSG